MKSSESKILAKNSISQPRSKKLKLNALILRKITYKQRIQKIWKKKSIINYDENIEPNDRKISNHPSTFDSR